MCVYMHNIHNRILETNLSMKFKTLDKILNICKTEETSHTHTHTHI